MKLFGEEGSNRIDIIIHVVINFNITLKAPKPLQISSNIAIAGRLRTGLKRAPAENLT